MNINTPNSLLDNFLKAEKVFIEKSAQKTKKHKLTTKCLTKMIKVRSNILETQYVQKILNMLASNKKINSMPTLDENLSQIKIPFSMIDHTKRYGAVDLIKAEVSRCLSSILFLADKYHAHSAIVKIIESNDQIPVLISLEVLESNKGLARAVSSKIKDLAQNNRFQIKQFKYQSRSENRYMLIIGLVFDNRATVDAKPQRITNGRESKKEISVH